MPPRLRAEPTADRATRKGRLTFQTAQVWEERDGRPDPAHRTASFEKRVIEIQVPYVGAPPRLAILAEESRFRASLPRQNRRPRGPDSERRQTWRPILTCSWNQRHASSVCHPANIAERTMPNGMLSCAACGRSRRPPKKSRTAPWARRFTIPGRYR